jgi:hypothetical protein
MTTQIDTRIDPDRLNALLGQAVVEFGATVNAALVVIGDRLGLYRALAGAGPLTPAELAGRTGTAERYVREWLGAQAASGFVGYDPDSVEPSVALTAAFPQFQKPDPDSFIANSSGKALFFASVAQDLLAAQQLQVSVIYHFDGKTYGPVANAAEANGPVASNGGLCRSSYGIDAMRQFLIIQK